MMKFYVYENWIQGKAVVHRGDCHFCKNGKGFKELKNGSEYGKWLGPFESKQAAEDEALKTGKQNVKQCWFCSKKKQDLVK